jgi:hypothetical protein
MLQFRLQMIMDGYVAGVATYYRTNAEMMDVAEAKLEMLKEDALKMCAKYIHELLRAWENYHRIPAAEAHMMHIQFREESRYPGFYYRMDFNKVDDVNLPGALVPAVPALGHDTPEYRAATHSQIHIPNRPGDPWVLEFNIREGDSERGFTSSRAVRCPVRRSYSWAETTTARSSPLTVTC